MIDRRRHLDRIQWLFRTFPVVSILGARQVRTAATTDLQTMAADPAASLRA
jgi:hypothetical protein